MNGCKRWLFSAALLFACSTLGGVAAAGNFNAGYPVNNCSNTAINALRACENEANGQYYVMIGQCENYWSAPDRLACQDEADETLAEELLLCQQQYEVRLELCGLLGEFPYDPQIEPGNFVSGINHPYLPFTPGTTLVYEGMTENGFEHVETYTSGETLEILGVECMVVTDTEWTDGQLTELTHDYFAQDVFGNVWYFGEHSWEFEDDTVVGVDGTWLSGEDGAKPGIIMHAYPPPLKQVYRQEFSLAQAEDLGQVLSLTQSVSTPFGDFDGCLQTRDSSPLEPDATEEKFYATPHGLVLTLTPGTDDRLELVAVIQE